MHRLLMLGLLAICIAGCSSKLETGYEPHKLGDSLVVKRGYYAEPYSPEAQAAQQDRQKNDIGYLKPQSGL